MRTLLLTVGLLAVCHAACAGVRPAKRAEPLTADVSAAVVASSEAAEGSAEGSDRVRAEMAFAEALERADLPVAALVHYAFALNASPGAEPLPAVERLVELQKLLGDTLLVPNLLGGGFREEWSKLRPETLTRVRYLLADVSHRRGKFEEARAALEAIPSGTAAYPQARYLLGVVLADPRFPEGPRGEEAVRAFEAAAADDGDDSAERERIRHLALLGLGRVHYALKQYDRASRAYERVPRFSPFWDQALFENSFARFQNDDFGGSMGSLQALHAPQFEGAFQPESWILKSTVYYFSCLYRESNDALNAYDRLYQPMSDRLRQLLEGPPREPEAWLRLVTSEEGAQLPRPVMFWVRDNERLRGMSTLLTRLDADLARVQNHGPWTGAVAQRLTTELEENRKTLIRAAGQLARNRLEEAARVLRNLNDQASIIRFETLKAEKEILESGVDQARYLQGQPLYRPQVPSEDWNYWKFQGEFWIDEMGYYQYTLKRGCPDDR